MPLSPTMKLLTHSFWKTATPEAVSELIRSGAELSAVRTDKNREREWGPLHYAAANARHPGVIQRLIEFGMNVEAGPAHGGLPLHVAARYGNCRTAQALLDLGADVNCDSRWNFLTPLHYARTPDMVKLLVSAGADPNRQSSYGSRTPLHQAMSHRRWAVGWTLINCGANIGAVDKSGWTPLHMAVSYATYVRPVMHLINLGADLFATTNSGSTVLDLALRRSDLARKDPEGLLRLQLRIAKETKRKAAAERRRERLRRLAERKEN